MIKIKYPVCIYSEASIAEAVSVYAVLAHIEVRAESGCYVLSFSGCKYDEQTTVREFENYLIGLENK